MRLDALLPALPEYRIENERDVEIAAITSDSRLVVPGALFVAYPGVSVDGARFIPQALERGAAAIVVEQPLPASSPDDTSPLAPHASRSTHHASRTAPPDPLITDHRSLITDNGPLITAPCPLITVPNARAALAVLAAAWHDFPSRKLQVIGVTGTDGKTTTCRLAASILAAAGHSVGTITTVAATIGAREIDTGFHTTTPDAPQVQAYLAQMVAAGMEFAVVEATSHGLAQHRLDAVEFDVAAVTNITHEHLDIHGTWENYRDAKALLFRSLAMTYRKPGVAKTAVLNADDVERGVFGYLRAIPADERVAYALDPGIAHAEPGDDASWITARDVVASSRGLRLTVVTPHGDLEIESPLIGRYNVSNILAAVGVGLAGRVPLDAIRRGIANVTGVVGRMQVMQAAPYAAIVDFAHTPNALRVALETARELATGRVIVVFGCAGLRDVFKRAWMGEIAGRLADRIVVTAEDPRTESLEAINAEIARGLVSAGRQAGTEYRLVADRGDAIAEAVRMAEPGDVVIVTGKGHERSMCFGTTERPWSDQEAVAAAIMSRRTAAAVG